MSPDTLRDLLPKLVRWVAILAVVLIVGSLIVSFVTTGSLNISTGSSDATITISPLSAQDGSTPGNAASKKGTGQLNTRVPAGTYIVTVQEGTTQTNQLVNVGWLSNQNLNLSPTKAFTTEPVLYESVQNIAADSTRMVYIDNDVNSIQYIDSHNQDANIPGDQYYTSVAWAGTSYGVAQDKSGKLYVINGNASHELHTPVSGPGLTYAIAPNKTIYIGLGSQVYRGTDSGNFTSISNDFSPHDSLIAANDKLLMVNSGSSNVNGSATVIGTDGKTTTKKFNYPVTGVSSWSPSGKYIEISVGANSEVFDSSLKQVGVIPQQSAIYNGTWLDDDTMFYGSGGGLWSYNLSQSASNLAANTSGQKLIQGVSISTDKSYVYFTTSNNTDDSNNNFHPRAVFRIGLHGQPVASQLTTLEDVLPISTPTFSIGLRNFAAPLTIDVTAYPGVDPDYVREASKETMQGMIDTSSVNFDIEAGD